jgi:opacity protein-like surface antigen
MLGGMLMFSTIDAQAQAQTSLQGLWALGLYGGVYGPTEDLEKVASTGGGGGLGLAYWINDNWLATSALSYHQFGEKKLADDVKISGAYAPLELGFNYFIGAPGKTRFYLAGRGGAWIGVGDFEETSFGLVAGLGVDFPVSPSVALQIEPDYYWVFEENTLTYWGLNFGLSWAVGAE